MKYRGIELRGKTAAIVGLGNIGNAIAERCAGLGMNVIYWSHSPKESPYEYKELPELLAEADVIFPTMALNDATKALLTPELLATMKPTALLVSVVHGLFDQEVVLEMVKMGKLFGYGFEAAPATFNDYEGNVWAAPAYAWVTDSSFNNSMTRWVENMVEATKGQFPTRIN